MLDFNRKIEFHVGDSVLLDGWEETKGLIESIRVISDAKLVEEYIGAPSDIVVTVRMKDAIVNKRGYDVVLVNSSDLYR
ncbi:MAG: hypothetical protein AB1656_04715 [Candidatus Omnitrophota bacterium]